MVESQMPCAPIQEPTQEQYAKEMEATIERIKNMKAKDRLDHLVGIRQIVALQSQILGSWSARFTDPAIANAMTKEDLDFVFKEISDSTIIAIRSDISLSKGVPSTRKSPMSAIEKGKTDIMYT